MDFGFDSFETSAFDVEIEDVEIKRTKRFERLWKIGSGGSVSFTRMKDGVLYFGACDEYFYAVDVETGKEVWRFRTGGVVTGRPTIAESMVFFTSFDQNCYALDIKTGKEVWRFRAKAEMFDGPAYSDGILIIGTRGGYIHGIDSTDGKEIWLFKSGDDIVSSATIHKDMAFIGSADSNLYCLSLRAGKEIWRFKTGDLIHNDLDMPVVENKIFFTSFDCNLYCLDYRTGKEIWRFRTGKYGISEPPVYHKGVLYQGTRDGIFYAISLEGKEIWRYKTGGLLTQTIVVSNRLYFGSEDGYFRCLDIEGNEIWRFKTDGMMWDKPSYWKGQIVFGTWSCHVHSLDAMTGEEVWRFNTSNKTPSSLLPPYEAFSTEIKKETHIEDVVSGDKYKKKKEETVSLSDYHIASEYHTESEYKQKSDYDVNFVMFENIMEVEDIWTSDSKVLIQPTLMSNSRI